MTDRVLITGGFGYLGGRIATELANTANYIVRLGSRKSKMAPDWLLSAETVAMDVMTPASLVAALTGVKVVVHLAAMNENESIIDPPNALLVNTYGTVNLLRAAIEAGVEQFVYLSTAHVYGAPLVGHITEKTLPVPIHPYAITHRAAEDFVLAAHCKNEIQGIVVRLSNGFGAPLHPYVDRWTLLVNDLCRQVASSGRMVLRSNGLQHRDFITLEDVGRAVKHLLGLTQKQLDDGLFNLGSEISSSIWDMSRHIAERCQIVLGFTPEIIRPAPRVDEMEVSLLYDCGKIKRTGFQLQNRFFAAIDETLHMSSRLIEAEGLSCR